MLTDDEINKLVYHHCGRMEDETTLQNVRDAARAVAEAAENATRANVLDAMDDDMPLTRALHLAELWEAGKLVGGDAHAVSLALLREVRRLRGA